MRNQPLKDVYKRFCKELRKQPFREEVVEELIFEPYKELFKRHYEELCPKSYKHVGFTRSISSSVVRNCARRLIWSLVNT